METHIFIVCIIALFVSGYISFTLSSSKIMKMIKRRKEEGTKIIEQAKKDAQTIIEKEKTKHDNLVKKQMDLIISSARKEAEEIKDAAKKEANKILAQKNISIYPIKFQRIQEVISISIGSESDEIIKRAHDEAKNMIEKARKESQKRLLDINQKIEYGNQCLDSLKNEIRQKQDLLEDLKKKNKKEEADEIIAKARQEAKIMIEYAKEEIHKIFSIERGHLFEKEQQEWEDDKLNIRNIMLRKYNDLEQLSIELKQNQEQQKEEFKENGGYTITDSTPRCISGYDFDRLSYIYSRYFLDKCQKIIKDGIKKDLLSKERELNKIRMEIESSGKVFNFEITDKFYSLMVGQMALSHKFHQMKEEKKEMEAMQHKALAEQIKAQKELEREVIRARKDEEQAKLSLQKTEEEAKNAAADKEKYTQLMGKIAALQNALTEAQSRMERATSMAQQTRSGWVYVISNIGSFGEGIYKIGMTRRLDPMERVIELGDASVPFPFDVHALIYSEDAPGLETALHKAFEPNKVNRINGKKEFFHVSLDDIKRAVHTSGYEVEFIDTPVAQQYRDTLFSSQAI